MLKLGIESAERRLFETKLRGCNRNYESLNIVVLLLHEKVLSTLISYVDASILFLY